LPRISFIGSAKSAATLLEDAIIHEGVWTMPSEFSARRWE
jgi:hypothetical protein